MTSLTHFVLGKFGNPSNGIIDSKDYRVLICGGDEFFIKSLATKVKEIINESYYSIYEAIDPQLPFPELIIKLCYKRKEEPVPFFVYARLYPISFTDSHGAPVPGLFHAFILTESDMAALGYKPWQLQAYFIKRFGKDKIIGYDDTQWLTEEESKQRNEPKQTPIEMSLGINGDTAAKYYAATTGMHVIEGDTGYSYIDGLNKSTLEQLYDSGVFLFSNTAIMQRLNGSVCKYIFTRDGRSKKIPSNFKETNISRLSELCVNEITKEQWVKSHSDPRLYIEDRIMAGSIETTTPVQRVASEISGTPLEKVNVPHTDTGKTPAMPNKEITWETIDKEARIEVENMKMKITELQKEILNIKLTMNGVPDRLNRIDSNILEFPKKIKSNQRAQSFILVGALLLFSIVMLFMVRLNNNNVSGSKNNGKQDENVNKKNPDTSANKNMPGKKEYRGDIEDQKKDSSFAADENNFVIPIVPKVKTKKDTTLGGKKNSVAGSDMNKAHKKDTTNKHRSVKPKPLDSTDRKVQNEANERNG